MRVQLYTLLAKIICANPLAIAITYFYSLMLSLLRQSTISVRVGVAFVDALQESILKAICCVSRQFLTFINNGLQYAGDP